MHIVSVRGQGSPLVLLHGSPSSPSAFEPLAKRLASAHRVFIAALPGYSGHAPLAPFSLERLHAGIEATLARESDEPWTFVGFSMGSFHALSVALRGNLPVRALAMLGAFAGVPEELAAAFREAAGAIRAGALPADVFPPRMLSEAFLAAHPEAREEMLRWLRETTLEVLADELLAAAASPPPFEALAKADFPLLVRTGELDVATPVAWSQAVARAALRATLEIVPGAGHALLIEDFPATSASLLRFLSAHAPA
jgi:pimeloyl-ACP methyl ester carboxylesterase